MSTSPSPSPSPSTSTFSAAANFPPPSKPLPVDFSPPLIVMVVVIATAFLIVTYSRLISRHVIPPILHLLRRHRRRLRRWRRRRRRIARSYLTSSSGGDLDSLPYDSPFFEHTDGYHVFSPYGLDESVIKTIPLSIYTAKSRDRECAVCLLEFEDDDYVRTLPICSHAFHVDCIDVWLRSHANCPLCRAVVFHPESPFTPVMAARIRPSLDESIFRSIVLEPLAERSVLFDPNRNSCSYHHATDSEITPCVDEPPRNSNSLEDQMNSRDFLLKRSYSFGFERSLASERMILEPATASPWRYRRGSFWSKRPSPFGSVPKARVFSFRYYRGMKSPFFRRRGGFFPLSESSWRFSNGVGGGSSRRSKSMTSPMFFRSSMSGVGAAAFSSSRLRCGDPEALLSPERFNRR